MPLAFCVMPWLKMLLEITSAATAGICVGLIQRYVFPHLLTSRQLDAYFEAQQQEETSVLYEAPTLSRTTSVSIRRDNAIPIILQKETKDSNCKSTNSSNISEASKSSSEHTEACC
jgi:hypothetical protein